MPTTEYDIQQLMAGWFADEGLVSDSDPMVSAKENAGNPHYLPTARLSARSIGRDELVLLDLWGKLDRPGAVYADITWVGYTGIDGSGRSGDAFAAVARRRDAAVALVQERGAERARTCAAGKWTGRPRACCAKPATAPRFCIEPATASAKTVHGTASTWTTTKPTTIVVCCPAPALRLNLACIFRFRRPVRNQHDRSRGTAERDRPAATSNSGSRVARRNDVHPQDDALLRAADRRVVARRRHGDRVAARPDADVVGADAGRSRR